MPRLQIVAFKVMFTGVFKHIETCVILRGGWACDPQTSSVPSSPGGLSVSSASSGGMEGEGGRGSVTPPYSGIGGVDAGSKKRRRSSLDEDVDMVGGSSLCQPLLPVSYCRSVALC